MKICGTCKESFPKTSEFFFKRVIKQKLSNGEIAIYNCFRSDCITCYGKKGSKRKVDKRCKDLKCNISEYQQKWKEQYSKTRTKHNIKKQSTIMKYHVENITDLYIANRFRKKVSELPKEIIETKRLIIKLKREINGK